jgi:hypothetical protein
MTHQLLHGSEIDAAEDETARARVPKIVLTEAAEATSFSLQAGAQSSPGATATHELKSRGSERTSSAPFPLPHSSCGSSPVLTASSSICSLAQYASRVHFKAGMMLGRAVS